MRLLQYCRWWWWWPSLVICVICEESRRFAAERPVQLSTLGMWVRHFDVVDKGEHRPTPLRVETNRAQVRACVRACVRALCVAVTLCHSPPRRLAFAPHLHHFARTFEFSLIP
jgi:hypothetical protein